VFRYLTPKKQIFPGDLPVELLSSKTFHMICNPSRAQKTVKQLITLRERKGITSPPFILWEPVPGKCSPEDWEECVSAMGAVDVISPNINEAASLLGKTIDEEVPFPDFKISVEDILPTFLARLGTSTTLVIRCGKHGCVIVTGDMTRWIPAYHLGEKVVDPTGGGNAFCGGFCVGWERSGELLTAGVYGNVAASFAIEQYGLPRLEVVDGRETWNGDTVENRLTRYQHLT
jgi:sugar/nucleoside kinase (ribokinase family)